MYVAGAGGAETGRRVDRQEVEVVNCNTCAWFTTDRSGCPTPTMGELDAPGYECAFYERRQSEQPGELEDDDDGQQ